MSRMMTFSLGIAGLSVVRDEWISMKGHRDSQQQKWEDLYDLSFPKKFGGLNTIFRYIKVLRRFKIITQIVLSVQRFRIVGCDLLGRKVVYNFPTISSNIFFERKKLTGAIL